MQKMTPAEAIEVLEYLRSGTAKNVDQALDMAIAALPEPLPLTHGILATPKMGCVATHNFVRRPEPIDGLREAIESGYYGDLQTIIEGAKRYLELTERV